MIKAIFGCVRGHVWCDNCNTHILRCPFDRDVGITQMRTIKEFLNEHAGTVKCHYCDFVSRRADVSDHMDKCEKRPIRPCDFWVFNPGPPCTYGGSQEEVGQHMKSPTSGHTGLMFGTVVSGQEQAIDKVCHKVGRMFLVKSEDDPHLWAAVCLFYHRSGFCIFVRSLCHHKHKIRIKVTKEDNELQYSTHTSGYDLHALTIRNSMTNVLQLPSVFGAKILDGIRVSVTFVDNVPSTSSGSKKRKLN